MDIIGLIGVIISWGERLFKAIKKFFEWRTQGSIKSYKKRFAKGMQTIIDNRDKAVRLLYNYYASSNTKHDAVYTIRYLYEDGHSRDMALITRPNLVLTKNPNFKIDSVYGGPISHFSFPKNELTSGKKKWDALGIIAYEGHKYSLYSVSENGTLEFRDTTFHTYRATFGEIYDEFVMTVADKGIDKLKNYSQSKQRSLLPLRKKYLGSLDRILDLHQRICAGGVITMFAARTPDDVVIYAQKRSAIVSDEPNLYTLVPRAFHESLISPTDEFNLETTIYRECYEELFKGEMKIGDHVEHDFYLSEKPGIRDLVAGKGVNHTLKPTALLWDLYRGNFIVTYCLYVHDQTWYAKYGNELTLNWEYASENKTAARASRSEVLGLLNRNDWAQDSYFAFVEGLRWLSAQEPLMESFNSKLPKLIFSRI
ncbi:MAG: hypothetical protein JETCAE02_05960 [Anaerolineaceae bacterium]|nr:hypothetical protein [Chloroflexota bacterium]WKZ55575.1 MAG: hypothetical protein QY324_05970 [Anaerolineales bacterium]GJQ38184.1 MAG: hypothetical protein JETCAE02_05960 [Anaerolineaceae bacterium]NOG76606.1 hypothetical protein [Chloroflexota bacterium]GIK09111.1 MAG: hypothetical protein BroJett001_11770 [Chloroflexota bacterium]